MFCMNCGKQLPDAAKYCSECGTPVARELSPPPGPVELPEAESPAGELPAAEAAVIVIDAPAPEDAEPAPEDAEPAPEQDEPAPEDTEPAPEQDEPAPEDTEPAPEEPEPAPRRLGKAAFAVLGAAGVLVIALAVLLVRLMSGGGKAAALAYLNSDGELLYLSDLKEKTRALELTDEAGYFSDVHFSPDGRTVYFTDSERTLYRVSAPELKKGSRPERISRDVSSFFVLDDGKLIYTQYDGGENRLSVYDRGDSFRLLRGYSEFHLSEDQKTIYYTERDESDNTRSLYKTAISGDAEKERLLKGADYIYSDFEDSVLLYGVSDSSAARGTVTVYSCRPGGDKTRLVSGVQSVTGVKVDGGSVSFYYYVEETVERSLYDFVSDSRAGEDAAAAAEPELDYPSRLDYAVESLWIDDTAEEYYLGMVCYTNGRGEQYPVDAGALMEGKTLEDLYDMYWQVYDIAGEDAQERYRQATQEYDAWYSVWHESESRRAIREELKSTAHDLSTLSLCRYTGSGKGEVVASGIDSDTRRVSSASDGVFLYRKVNTQLGKVCDLSELDYAWQVEEKLRSGESVPSWYQNVNGRESVIADLEDVTNLYSIYILNGRDAVLDVYDGHGNSLRAYTLGKDSLTYTATIIEDGFSGPYRAKSSGRDVLYLFTNVEAGRRGSTGDFCVYRDGGLETVASEIYGALVLDESGTTYVVTDIDSRESIELSLLKKGETTVITDELGDMEPIFPDGTQMLYLSDGDLMLWNGKDNRRLARDVEAVWTGTREICSEYRVSDSGSPSPANNPAPANAPYI